jgi:membrane-bound metal-dependent hydrolase YbcI (DUF457 family)
VIAGHFGFAAGVKSVERPVPLWALMLATVWLDVLFVPLYSTGVETLRIVDGGGYGNAIIHADYTHSLIGALLLSALFGVVAARRWATRAGVVLGAVAFSHWVFDLVVHRPDLPLLPGNAGDLPRLGFGLWRVKVASVLVELALVVGGSFLYWRAATQTEHGAGASDARNATVAASAVLIAGLVTLAVDAFLA